MKNTFLIFVIAVWSIIWLIGTLKMVIGNFFEGFVMMALALIIIKQNINDLK